MDRDTIIPKVKKLPGPLAKKWINYGLKYTATTTLIPGFVWDRTKPAIGPFCTDVDGNVFLDFVSHVASAPLGYNHPEIIRLMQDIKAIDPDRYAGCDFIAAYGDAPEHADIPTPAQLHHKVVEITKQFKFDMAFFTNSGAEAVENAMKICYDHRKNNGYGICFEGAFHGRTLGALSLNRSKAVQRKYYPAIPKIVTLPYCHCKHCSCGWITYSRKGKPENKLNQLFDKDTGTIQPENVAYIIIEPIQGEGGFAIPKKEFIKDVYREAQQYGIPVISDEIQAGLGRTGKWWACEHFGVKPDVITSSKGLRVGATIAKKKMFPKEKGRISSTWGEGNAIASAVGYKTIEIIQQEKLVQNAAVMGKYFLKRLEELKQKYHKVYDVRGIGLMDAIEFESKKIREQVQRECLKRGLLLIEAGFKSLRLLPPLNVTTREIDLAVDIIRESVKVSR